MRWAVLAFVLSGCQLLFERPDLASDASPPEPDGPSVTERCSTIHMLDDDFNATALDEKWIQQGTGGFTHDQFVQFDGPAPFIGSDLSARHYYDLRDAGFAVDLINASAPPDGTVGVELLQTNTDRLLFELKGDRIQAWHVEGSMFNDRGSAAYDPAGTRLRIRNEGDQLLWEVNTGGGFTVIGSETVEDALSLRLIRPRLFVVGGQDVASTAQFDTINDGTPSGEACPLGDLADDFAPRADVGPAWAQSNLVKCTFSLDGGFNVDLPMQSNLFGCNLTAAGVFDARQGNLAVEVSAVGQGTMRFGLRLDNDESFDFTYRFEAPAKLTASINGPNSVTIDSKTYDPTAHRWWRFRYSDEGAATLFFETSTDGAAWVVFAQTNDARLSKLRSIAPRLDYVSIPDTPAQRFTVSSIGPR